MRRLIMILLPCITLILSSCAGQSSSFLPADNVSEFSTQSTYDGGPIPQDVLKRAAYTTLRRGYTHFTINVDNSTRKSGLQPSVGIGYGSSPSSFGISGGGIGFVAGITTTSSPRTKWKVTMYKTDGANLATPQGQRLYNAADIAR